jgi:hypothetical protein
VALELAADPLSQRVEQRRLGLLPCLRVGWKEQEP